MVSTTKRGNYYKNKTREYYQKLGYTVELTEFVCGRQVAPGKIIYSKKDILASDGIAYNDTEFILWNSKSVIKEEYVSKEKSQGKKDYEKIKVPPFIKKQLVIWQSRKEPIVINI